MDEITPQPTSSKSYLGILIVILILLIIGGGVWYFLSLRTPSTTVETATPATTAPTTTPPATPTTGTTSEEQIKSDADLQTAASDLDSTNIDSIDTTLNQNDADAAQF